jgi:Cu2+-exporting ATPase
MAEALSLPINPAGATSMAASEAPKCRVGLTTLAVENLHCGSCIGPIEDALRALDGVSAARVNLSTRRVVAEHDLIHVTPDQLISALEKVGFRSAELSDAGAGPLAGDSDLTRRLGVAGFAAMNIMLLSVSVWSGAGGDMDQSVQSLFHWLSALIALPAVAYAGVPFFRSAAGALRSRRLNMDVPISLGVILATAMSLFQTIRGSEQVYFDAAVTLLAFLLVGRLLDYQMRTRAAGAAANLLGLRMTSALVLRQDGTPERVSVRSLEPGMCVLAAAGERIAADGIIRRGESDVDEGLITGESLPRPAKEGDRVFAGTINLTQPLTIEVTAREENTLLSEISRLMAAAEQSRGLYVRLADRAARLYAPAVHVLGLSTFIGWMIGGFAWDEALTAAIAVLIITCPCALALAVPAVQVAATGALFSKGIILKSADGLERLAEIDTIVFDKTGTLTLGEPQLLNLDDIPPATLERAAALAASSRHPYARAIVAAAHKKGMTPVAHTETSETAGFGLSRKTVEGEERLGSARWCGLEGTDTNGNQVWYAPASGSRTLFRFSDRIRVDAKDVISALKKDGYALEIISGDRARSVQSLASEVGPIRWSASNTPTQKIARLEELTAQGKRVLMVGDGLNDAPALAAAYASMSPSTAADISQTAADAIFQGAHLAPVAEALRISKAAHRLALQNFALAIAYNVVFVPLAMAGLVTPLIAALAMSASSVTVTANAMRIRSPLKEIAP